MSAAEQIKAASDLVRVGRDNPVVANEILAMVDRILNGSEAPAPKPTPALTSMLVPSTNGHTNGHASRFNATDTDTDEDDTDTHVDPRPTRRGDGRWNGHTNWHRGVHFDDLDPVTQAQIKLRRVRRHHFTQEEVEEAKENLARAKKKYEVPKPRRMPPRRRGRQPMLVGRKLHIDQARKRSVTYTAVQVAELFGVKPLTVGHWCRTGRVNAKLAVWDEFYNTFGWLITHLEVERIDRDGFLPLDLNRNY